VQDSSGAYIPGVTVTAANIQTGVATTAVTNESGAYNIPSLLPGTYKLSAELPGFKTRVFNDVVLGASNAARYNFTLDVGALTDQVEVTAERANLIAETSPTIGQVLTEEKVRDLPLVTNNVLDLMKTMPGVRGGIYSSTTTFAGISASAVNTTRDGLSVQEGRYAYGVGSTTLMNPDMVGEFRVILAPVTRKQGAAMGRFKLSRVPEPIRSAAAPCGTFETPLWMPTRGPTINRSFEACGLHTNELAEFARILGQPWRPDQKE
jgi:hypothetical protein